MTKCGLFVLIFTLMGCVNSGEMKKFPAKDYPRLTQESFSQEETVVLEHITVRYVPSYREGSQKVRIKGNITLNRDNVPQGSLVTEFALKLFGREI